jgi:hypothetical protein
MEITPLDRNIDVELSHLFTNVNLSKDNHIPNLSLYIHNIQGSLEEYNDNFFRLIEDYQKTHEWLKMIIVDQSIITNNKNSFLEFIDEMLQRLKYYDEAVCFNYKHPYYSDISDKNRERMIYIEISLRESIQELEDWKKMIMIEIKDQEHDQTANILKKTKKMKKKSRIDITIEKMKKNANNQKNDSNVAKLQKTIRGIYDFHHLSFEFIQEAM